MLQTSVIASTLKHCFLQGQFLSRTPQPAKIRKKGAIQGSHRTLFAKINVFLNFFKRKCSEGACIILKSEEKNSKGVDFSLCEVIVHPTIVIALSFHFLAMCCRNNCYYFLHRKFDGKNLILPSIIFSPLTSEKYRKSSNYPKFSKDFQIIHT